MSDTDVPALLDENLRLKAELAELRLAASSNHVWRRLLASRKFQLALASMAVYIAGRLGLELSQTDAMLLGAPLMAAIAGTAAEDVARHRAQAKGP